MIVHKEYAQGSLEWLTARAGIPTASEFDSLVNSKFEIRTGEMPKSYLAQKLAEKWRGGPLPGYLSIDMEYGSILEEQALPWYEMEFNETVQRVGFITTDDEKIGCSPDGLVEGMGIEIKCPKAETHVKYLLAGEVPKDYLAQIHGGMLVTGYNIWRFVSYRREFPPLVLAVERDDKIQDNLRQALDEFLGMFDAGWKKLCEANGGPPRRAARPELAPVEIGEDYKV